MSNKGVDPDNDHNGTAASLLVNSTIYPFSFFPIPNNVSREKLEVFFSL